MKKNTKKTSKEIKFFKIRKSQRKIRKRETRLFRKYLKEKNRHKDPSKKNKTMFLSDCKDEGKNIFKRG